MYVYNHLILYFFKQFSLNMNIMKIATLFETVCCVGNIFTTVYGIILYNKFTYNASSNKAIKFIIPVAQCD